MGFGAVALLVMMFALSRVFEALGKGLKHAKELPPRQPGAAPQTMTELLAEMRQQLEAAQRLQAKRLPPNTTVPQPQLPTSVARRPTSTVARGPSPKRLPEVEAERGGSIEVASREGTAIEIDRDDDAEGIARRRIEAAQARNREWQQSDH